MQVPNLSHVRKHVALVSLAVTAGLSLSACAGVTTEEMKSEIASLEEEIFHLELKLDSLEKVVGRIDVDSTVQSVDISNHEICLEDVVSFIDDLSVHGGDALRWWYPSSLCP